MKKTILIFIFFIPTTSISDDHDKLIDPIMGLVGSVSKAGQSMCNDGATHYMDLRGLGPIRLEPIDDKVLKNLKKYENSKAIVTVEVQHRRGPLCDYYLTHSIKAGS